MSVEIPSPDLPDVRPNPAAREAAIARAMAAFDAAHGASVATAIRSDAVRARPPRKAFRAAVAAGVALLVAVPVALEVRREAVKEEQRERQEAAPAKPQAPASQSSTDRTAYLAEPRDTSAAKIAAGRPEAVAAVAEMRPAPSPLPPAPLPKMRQAPQGAAAGLLGGMNLDMSPSTPPPPVGRDSFANARENGFRTVQEAPLSTFSIDVDTASYGYVRAALNHNLLPQPEAVRTEELVNYFPYDYAPPASADGPFRTDVSVFPNPLAPGRKLMRIGVKGFELPSAQRPRANLVFLIDTSGSMNQPDKLPLLKQSFALLLDKLGPKDSVAIVAYAGSAGTVLAPTPASDKARILAALDALSAGGSTAGGEGIRQAYALAEAGFDPGAVNRVMLATDGDFNVGITSTEELKGFIERERGKGIFLSVLGFGMGNLKDDLMQALAQNGNGVAAYIDTLNEARKVLVEEASASLFPIAKDVKIQVEFNPAEVVEYRLVGYETRLLAREDFNNDKVDAGEVGSGQSVTAIYDIVPAGGPRTVDASRYQPAPAAAAQQDGSRELAFVKIRYKLPSSDTSQLITSPVGASSEVASIGQAPTDARFATAVAAFGELLRGGKHTGTFDYDKVLQLALGARGDDPYGYRIEFINLVRAAKSARGLQEQ